MIKETAVDMFETTSYSKALADDDVAGTYTFGAGLNRPCFENFPKFAEDNGFRNPVDPMQTNFRSWNPRDGTFFDFLAAEPSVGDGFNRAMKVYSSHKVPWTSLYPLEEITNFSRPGRAWIVDVGGGIGHDLEKFKERISNIPDGALILQDQEKVLSTVKVSAPLLAQAHDFFELQPVKGARAYYMHLILHDWPDEKATQILKALVPALERGYSRILIHENVILPVNAHPTSTVSDLTMMMSFSSLERDQAQWNKLIEAAGLRVSRTYTSPDSFESILEVELA